jgi:hypothetical protein
MASSSKSKGKSLGLLLSIPVAGEGHHEYSEVPCPRGFCTDSMASWLFNDTSKTVCRTFLEAEQIVPEDSLFQDYLFDETCEMIQDRNEAKVIQDIARLIVPSAQSLAIHGAKRLKTFDRKC